MSPQNTLQRSLTNLRSPKKTSSEVSWALKVTPLYFSIVFFPQTTDTFMNPVWFHWLGLASVSLHWAQTHSWFPANYYCYCSTKRGAGGWGNICQYLVTYTRYCVGVCVTLLCDTQVRALERWTWRQCQCSVNPAPFFCVKPIRFCITVFEIQRHRSFWERHLTSGPRHQSKDANLTKIVTSAGKLQCLTDRNLTLIPHWDYFLDLAGSARQQRWCTCGGAFPPHCIWNTKDVLGGNLSHCRHESQNCLWVYGCYGPERRLFQLVELRMRSILWVHVLYIYIAVAHLWVQLPVRLLEPEGEPGSEEWGLRGGGSENIWQERRRIGEGANLIVGGSKVKTECVRLIRASGLMSRLQARGICAFSRGTCADVTEMCKQIVVDFCPTVFGLLTSVRLHSAGRGRVPPWVTSTLTILLVRPQWGCINLYLLFFLLKIILGLLVF